MATYRASYSAAEKREFSRKLRQLMLDQGIQGADLARRASKQIPGREKPMPRQSITSYLQGTIPDEPTLRALEKVLNAPPQFLLPRPHALAPGELDTTPMEPEQDVRYSIVEGGMMKLNISAAVPREIGQQILALLHTAGH